MSLTPYGLCEKWIVEEYNIEHIDFPLSDAVVAAIGQSDFEKISNAFGGYVIPSNFAGAYISLHEFWIDFDIIDAVTDGAVKETHEYLSAATRRDGMSNEDVSSKAKDVLTAVFSSIESARIEIADTIAGGDYEGETLIAGVDMGTTDHIDAIINIEAPDDNIDATVDDSGIQPPRFNRTDEIESAFPGMANNEYLAKLLTYFINGCYIINGSNWVFSDSSDIDLHEIARINRFQGTDIVVFNHAIYGDPVSDYITINTVEDNNGIIEGIGTPNTPVSSVSMMPPGDNGVDYNAAYIPVETPFCSCVSIASDYSITSGEVLNAGDYKIGFIRGSYVKTSYDLQSVALTLVAVLNGSIFNYTIDHRGDAFNKVGFEVTEDGFYYRCRPQFEEVIVKLTSTLKRDVNFVNGRYTSSDNIYMETGLSREQINAIKDNLITIYLASSSEFSVREVHTSILGVNSTGLCIPKIINGNSGYEDFDLIFRDTVSNNVFAVMKGSDIIITAMVKESDYNLLIENILFRLESDKTYNEIREHDEEFYKTQIAFSKDDYGKMFVKDVMKSINDKKRKMKTMEEEYNELMDRVMNLASEIRSTSVELSCIDIDKLQSDNEEIAKKDFDNILGLDLVSNVLLSGGTLNVFTKNVYVKHDVNGKWYDIGTFHIKVNMTSDSYDTSGSTRIYNTKYDVNAYEDGMNAPHVFRNGSLCHGNLARGVANSYRDKDVFGVIYQILIFLQSANLDDVAGAKLDRWVEVSEDVALNRTDDSSVLYGVPEATEFDSMFEDALNSL